MAKIFEHLDLTVGGFIAFIANVAVLTCAILYLDKSYRDVFMLYYNIALPIVAGWLMYRHMKLKNSMDLLAAQYYENFLKPLCEHVDIHGGITLSDGTRYENCRITAVIPNDYVTKDMNPEVAKLEEKLRLMDGVKIISDKIRCSGRDRAVMLAISENGVQIIDLPTVLSGAVVAIEMFYPNIYHDQVGAYIHRRRIALGFFRQRLQNILRREESRYGIMLRAVTEKELRGSL